MTNHAITFNFVCICTKNKMYENLMTGFSRFPCTIVTWLMMLVCFPIVKGKF